MQLTQGYLEKGRNITTDTCFTSVKLQKIERTEQAWLEYLKKITKKFHQWPKYGSENCTLQLYFKKTMI